MILNLGAGRNQRADSTNVDVTAYPGIQQVVDLTKFPWPWADESIDGIHASHLIEHFKDQEQFIWECLRILKKGGFLRLNLPHSSNVTAIGCMGHYRTYSYNTCHGYLGMDFYMFGKAKFKTVERSLNWWYEVTDAQGDLPGWIFHVIRFMNPIINFFINLSPRIAENTWCYLIGGFREVIWKGVKL